MTKHILNLNCHCFLFSGSEVALSLPPADFQLVTTDFKRDYFVSLIPRDKANVGWRAEGNTAALRILTFATYSVLS